MALLSWRESLRKGLPPWLLDRPSIKKTAGFRALYSYGMLLDAASQMLVEGLRSGLPTLAHPSALPFLGRDRQIFRGPLQSDADYAAWLTEYLSLWRQAGNAWSLARSLQRYLGPDLPRLRVVTRGGFWITLEADGTVEFHHGGNWDWDSHTHPERASKWWWIWVIVYEPHLPDAGVWGVDDDEWGDDAGFGNETPGNNLDAIKALVEQWKGAHAHPTLIWTYDENSFDPSSIPGVTPNYPDGWWGNWSREVGGVQVPTRFEDARYWEWPEP